MPDLTIDDKEFIEFLSLRKLKEEYIQAKKDLFTSIDNNYAHQQSTLEQTYLKEIGKDQQHRRILNTCIFPFIEQGQLTEYGYHFIRASPLYEKDVPNFDFLVFHTTSPNIAIFGEAKGNANSPDDVIQQTKERIQIVEKFRNYITDMYLNTSSEFEFVVCTGWPDAYELMKSIARKGGGIIVWNSSIPIIADEEKQELLDLLVPGSYYGMVNDLMVHKDKNLNKHFHKIRTSSQCKDFFIDSHRFSKLLIINYADGGKNDGVFTFTDLFELVKDTLDYLDTDTIRKETEEILNFAKDNLSFVDELQNQPGSYRIVSKGKKAAVREKELRDKWINYKIEQKKYEEKYSGLIEIQEQFKRKRKLQRNINEF